MNSFLVNLINLVMSRYCNWNVTTSTPRANYRNHVPLPLDHRALREWEVMGLFREPRRRLVSGECLRPLKTDRVQCIAAMLRTPAMSPNPHSIQSVRSDRVQPLSLPLSHRHNF